MDSYSYAFTLTGTYAEGTTPTYSLINTGSYGTATVNASTGQVTYESSSTQSVIEEITFIINDGYTDSEPGTVSIDHRTDPLYKHAWHLKNTGQANFASTSGTPDSDTDVAGVIISGWKGEGIKVGVIDEDLEISHEDLAPNIIEGNSYDVIDGDYDPSYPEENIKSGHGTGAAGIIAARGWNDIGTRGVAPKATLSGCNYLEATSFENWKICFGDNSSINQMNQNDIFNISLGSYGTGGTDKDENDEDIEAKKFAIPYFFYYPSQLQDWENRVSNYRSGKGAIIVKSAGNGWRSDVEGYSCGPNQNGLVSCDQASFEDDQSVPYTISVAALNALDEPSSYSSSGSGIWVSGYGGEFGYNTDEGWNLSSDSRFLKAAVMSTDRSRCSHGYVGPDSYDQSTSVPRNEFQSWHNPHPENPDCNYTSAYNGTSAAAPTVSGVVALLLDQNENLTWRDVKHILASSSRIVNADDSYDYRGVNQYKWTTNAAGYSHHNRYGFGAINSYDAAVFAATHEAGSLGSFVQTDFIGTETSLTIEDSTIYSTAIALSKPPESEGIVEYIQFLFTLNHAAPHTVGISLLSPSGTEITIVNPYHNGRTNPYDDETFSEPTYRPLIIGVAGFYGESMDGDWTVKIADYEDDGISGTVERQKIKIFGR